MATWGSLGLDVIELTNYITLTLTPELTMCAASQVLSCKKDYQKNYLHTSHPLHTHLLYGDQVAS